MYYFGSQSVHSDLWKCLSPPFQRWKRWKRWKRWNILLTFLSRLLNPFASATFTRTTFCLCFQWFSDKIIYFRLFIQYQFHNVLIKRAKFLLHFHNIINTYPSYFLLFKYFAVSNYLWIQTLLQKFLIVIIIMRQIFVIFHRK